MAGYTHHFGLRKAPFTTSPDPEFAYATREHQLAVAKIQYAVEEQQGIFLLQGEIGTGKCLGRGTPILLFDGTVKPVEEVRIGDLLMGPDSTPRTVLSLARGVDRLYRVVPVKGDPYVVNEAHILSLKMTRIPKGRGSAFGFRPESGQVVNVSVTDYLNRPVTFRRNAKGWRTGVEFAEQEVALPPYLLGLWLGDGDARNPRFTTADVPVVDYLEDAAPQLGLRVHRVTVKGDRCPMYDLTTGKKGGENPVRAALRSYGLLGDKHVPLCYKANSRAIRLDLLAGIIDTDGTLSGGGYEITLKSERLAEDVAFLARSLGFAAYRRSCAKTCHNNGAVGDYHRVFISGDVCLIPVRIPRKRTVPRTQKKDVLVTGVRVEEAGFGEYFGFEIDGDRLFLLGDFTVTHNTTVSQLMLNAWRGEKSLAVAHIINPSVRTPSQFLRMLLGAYGVEPPHLLSDNWDALRSLLVGNYRDGKTTVAVIDEAQTISAENMETLTHISNEQTQKAKLIQVVLLAQPNIARKLTYKPALRDRIAHGSTLNPLTFEDSVAMLRHRCSVAGGDFDALFPGEAIHRRLYNATKGIPRRLCMLCDNALLNAFALRKKAADDESVDRALEDLAFKGWKDKAAS